MSENKTAEEKLASKYDKLVGIFDELYPDNPISDVEKIALRSVILKAGKEHTQITLQAIIEEVEGEIKEIESNPNVSNEEMGRLRAYREVLEILTNHL